MLKDVKRDECSKCKSHLVYLRIKTSQMVCRNCGHIERINDETIAAVKESIEKNKVVLD